MNSQNVWIVAQVNMKDPQARNQQRCVLLINGFIYQPLLKFFRFRDLNLKTEHEYARALKVFLLWFHDVWPKHDGVLQKEDLIFEFAQHIKYGETNNPYASQKPTALPSSHFSRHNLLQRFINFSKWLVENNQNNNLDNLYRQPTWEEAIRSFYQAKALFNGSMMMHLFDKPKLSDAFEKPVFILPNNIRNPIVKSEIRAFPIEKFSQLIWTGFRRPNVSDSEPCFWKKWNLRDILITLILGFGGKRESEPCHIWIEDIKLDTAKPGSAIINIVEPILGKYRFQDPVTGQIRILSRTEYLKEYCNSRIPLVLETGRRRAGWKGNLLHDNRDLSMRVFWIHPSAGMLFTQLWQMYLLNVRPIVANNPYAFLTKDGQPIGPSAYFDSLKRAVKRINLEYGKQFGTTPHSLRHMYGQQLKTLNLDRKINQLMFGHKNPFSQDIYMEMNSDEIDATIQSATKNRKELGLTLPENISAEIMGSLNFAKSNKGTSYDFQ